MSGSSIQKYVIPGAETAIGVGSEIIAPGNPIGLGLAGSGIGQLAGGAAGGNKGQAIGGGIGGLAGGLGGSMSGLLGGSGASSGGLGSLLSMFSGGTGNSGGGFAMPGMSGTPSMASMSGSLPSFINPSDVIGVSTDMAGGGSTAGGLASLLGGGGSSSSSPLSGLGSIGQQYLQYVLASKLQKQGYVPPRAPAFSSAPGVMPGALAIQPAQFPTTPRIG